MNVVLKEATGVQCIYVGVVFGMYRPVFEFIFEIPFLSIAATRTCLGVRNGTTIVKYVFLPISSMNTKANSYTPNVV